MPSTFGTKLSVTPFGQSHSAGVGCVVEGLPSGFPVDLDALESFVSRRAPGKAPWDTPRKEQDSLRILSGLNPDGVTCGAQTDRRFGRGRHGCARRTLLGAPDLA